MNPPKSGDAFAGIAVCIILAGIVCVPILGWPGIAGAAAALYCALVFINGADAGAKRQQRSKKRGRS